MRSRPFIFGLVVAGLATTSCSSIARDALVDAYEGDDTEVGQAEACQVDAKTLETASEAFFIDNSTSPTSFDDLVPGYLVEAPANWVIDDGVGVVSNLFSPISGGPCDGVDLTAPITTSDDNSIGNIGAEAIAETQVFDCSYDKRVLDVAIETYFVLNEVNPSTIGDLVQFGLIDDQDERWIIDPTTSGTAAATAIPAVGNGCDQ
ncbi:MAG: hypothetical protein AB8G14_11205 [Ilumatobacter sp.]